MDLNNGDNQTKYPDNQINSEHKTSYKQIQLHNLLMPQCMLRDMGELIGGTQHALQHEAFH